MLKSGREPEHRGFTAATRAEEGENFPLPDLEGYGGYGLDRSELFGDVMKFQELAQPPALLIRTLSTKIFIMSKRPEIYKVEFGPGIGTGLANIRK
jgi:hypothetical protein